MPENTNQQDPNTPGGTQQPGNQPPANPPAPNNAAPPAGGGGGAPPNPDKTVVVPTSAFKRIKEEEYQRGQQEALDAIAREAGYGSHTELAKALASLKNPPAPQTPAAPPAPNRTDPNTDPDPEELAEARQQRRAEGKFQRQLENTLNERNKYANDAKRYREEAEAKAAEVDAIRAEMHLRTIAARVGIQDIDYAIHLFSQDVERLTPEEAEKFDEKAYFESKRKSHPYLFGEQVVPATTGPGVGGAPTSPSPTTVTRTNGAAGKVDAMGMSAKEFQAELRKRGLSPV